MTVLGHSVAFGELPCAVGRVTWVDVAAHHRSLSLLTHES
jgi:hypothetical protein